jgi:hypothetical protein
VRIEYDIEKTKQHKPIEKLEANEESVEKMERVCFDMKESIAEDKKVPELRAFHSKALSFGLKVIDSVQYIL